MPVAEEQTSTGSGSSVMLLLTCILGVWISAVVALVVQYATLCLFPMHKSHACGSGDHVAFRR